MRSNIYNIVPYNPGKSVDEIEKEVGKKIHNLSANESPWGPSPLVKEYLYKQIENINYYPDGAARDLKSALALYWGLSEKSFCLGNGADEIITMIANAFINPNDEVVIPTPTFSEYATSVKICGGICKLLPQPSLYINIDDIIKNINKNTRMIFICNPNNPTGTLLSHNEILRLMNNIPENVIVILDEAYCHYANDLEAPRTNEIIKDYANIIVLRTFSKVYGLAGLRIGYAVGQEENIQWLERVRQPFNVNKIAQKAALIALNDKEHIKNVIKQTIKEREWVINQLNKLGIDHIPSQTNFVFINMKRNAGNIAQELKNEGILVRQAASFGFETWIRISFSTHDVMQTFINTIGKLY